MAFESKYKSQGEMCPICRRQFTDGRKIDNPAYGETGQAMCKDCFNRLYKNRKKNRTAAKKATYKAKGDSVRNQEVLDNIRAILEETK